MLKFKNLKKTIFTATAVITGALALAGCSAGGSGNDDITGTEGPVTDESDETIHTVSNGEKLKIVTTIFPEYDWVRNILGENTDAELTLLCDSGTDLHSYQPTVDDVMKIADCDVFIYTGGESDEWVEDAIKTSGNTDLVSINLLEALGSKARQEEEKEGMQEHEHEHEGEHEEAHEETEYDEHIWLSLSNAQILTEEIAGRLEAADPQNADIYKTNADKYIGELSSLDEQYRHAADDAANKTLIFADRFPFLYMTKDYGLDYFAAFNGCSAETEASFETITFLAAKADELSANCIFTIEGSDGRIAQTVIDNTTQKNQKIAELDSMQSVTAEQINAGVTYLSVMEKNLEVLKEALN